MARFILRRVVLALATAAGIAILSFLALYARPGEAVRVQANSQGIYDEQGHARVQESLGLDRPLPEQLLRWLYGLAHGDLGESWSRPGSSVLDVLMENLPLTLALTGGGLLLQVFLGVAIAAASVRKRGSWQDVTLTTASMSLYAIPEFCVGLLLLWPLSVKLGWFPLSGAANEPWLETGLLERLHHLFLPALCLGLGSAAVVSRLLKVRWEEEMESRYVVAARARGISGGRILWGHTLKSAAGPLCTAIGLSLPGLIGGAVIVEEVFNWPGLGRVMIQAVGERDLPLLAGVNVLLATLVCLGGFLSDLLWTILDPRVDRS